MVELPDRLLLADTCAILDLVRSPVRKTVRAADVAAARALIARAGAEPDLLAIGLPAECQTEFHEHFEDVQTATRNELARLSKDLAHIAAVGSSFGVPDYRAFSLEGWEDSLVRHASELGQLVVEKALELSSSQEDRDAGYQRVLAYIAPARRGSRSVFDSIITETTLRLGRLRPSGTTFLLSTNHRDFCDGRVVRPPLGEQFQDAGVTFVRSWREAAGRIGM